jgi:thymidine kinase
MAKLYFRYGAMGSAKTMNLLAVAHNYEQQGKKVVLIKPALDDRFGADIIRSRAGLERRADICVQADSILDYSKFNGIDCIIVDECQFLSEEMIHQLRNVTVDLDIPVICYGLRTNFMTRLFEGSKRLMELADTIEEVKTTCAFCNRKAVYNIKIRQGNACTSGQEIELGAENLYQPTCCRCFEERIGEDNPLRNQTVELWLVRHGETNENAAGILSGQIEAQLSERGIAQAEALKPKLANIKFDNVYASSLQRTINTAKHAGFDPIPVDEIREFCFGDYDGKIIKNLDQDWVRALYTFTEFTTPNGESIADVSTRVTAFVNTLPAGRHILFCHGGVIRTIGRHLGVDRFIGNGTALIVDWTHKYIKGHIDNEK